MDNLWSEIVNKLIENNLTIATMESCTGGGVANEITSISGASAVIKESYVTYCNEAKIKQGVPAETIEKYTGETIDQKYIGTWYLSYLSDYSKNKFVV
jgi:PncC family amidohydrolase